MLRTSLIAFAVLAAPSLVSAGVPELVAELASPRFADREAASAALRAVGEPALPALRDAVTSTDPERAERAAKLIRVIERDALHRQLLLPVKVRLNYRDTPLSQVVADVRKQTGIEMQFANNATPSVRLTLDTGEVPAWEAVERVLSAAMLREDAPAVNNDIPMNVPQFQSYRVAMPPPFSPHMLKLAPGPRVALPTACDGPVRVRVLPTEAPGATRSRGDNRLTLMLEATPLPSLGWQSLQEVRVDRAIDDRGRSLEAMATPDPTQAGGEQVVLWGGGGMQMQQVWIDGVMQLPSAPANPHQLPMSLRYDGEGGKYLKELRGVVIGRVLAPPTVVLSVGDIEAKGTHRGDGVAVKFHGVELKPSGAVGVHLTIQTAIDPMQIERNAFAMPRAVRIRGKAMGFIRINEGLPTSPPEAVRFELFDADGKALKFVVEEVSQVQQSPGVTTEELVVRFQQQEGQGEPKRLRVLARKLTDVEVPFALQNVPLP